MSKTYFGIDVSEHNGILDWTKIAKSVDYAILRVGYRGYGSAGNLKEDKNFKTNIEGAIKNGIPVGIYWFAQEINEMEAIAAANYVHNLIKNYKIILPVYYDTEMSTADPKGTGRADDLSKNARTSATIAFCKRIENLGYKAGIYASESWFKSHIDFSRVKNYHIWVAKYSENKPSTDIYDIWQYSSKGKLNGLSGNFDVNYMYVDLISPPKPVYEKWTGYVTADKLNVRSKPNTDSTVLGQLTKGASKTIKGVSGDFYKITYKDKTAYVSKKYISKNKPDMSWAGVVTATLLNVRAKANINSKVLGTLKHNSSVKVNGESGEFYKITYKNQTAYVAKRYIKKK